MHASNGGMRSTRQGGVRMVAEVPALDERVKAVMEAEAAMEAQSEMGKQGISFPPAVKFLDNFCCGLAVAVYTQSILKNMCCVSGWLVRWNGEASVSQASHGRD